MKIPKRLSRTYLTSYGSQKRVVQAVTKKQARIKASEEWGIGVGKVDARIDAEKRSI